MSCPLGRLLPEAANLPLSRRTWSRHCVLLIVAVYTDPESSLWILRTSARSPLPDQTDVLWRPDTQPVTFCSKKGPSDRAIKKYDLFTKQSVQKPGHLSGVAVFTMKQLLLPLWYEAADC